MGADKHSDCSSICGSNHRIETEYSPLYPGEKNVLVSQLLPQIRRLKTEIYSLKILEARSPK